MSNLESAREILVKNDYQVVAYATNNGCVVVYPNRVEPPIADRVHIQYTFMDGELLIESSDEQGETFNSRTIECVNYIQRLVMFTHIIARCMQIDYAVSMVNFIVDEKEVNELEFYDRCSSEYIDNDKESRKKEMILKQVIIQCMFTKFTDSHKEYCRENGVLDGYIRIKNLLTGSKDEEENSVVG